MGIADAIVKMSLLQVEVEGCSAVDVLCLPEIFFFLFFGRSFSGEPNSGTFLSRARLSKRHYRRFFIPPSQATPNLGFPCVQFRDSK